MALLPMDIRNEILLSFSLDKFITINYMINDKYGDDKDIDFIFKNYIYEDYQNLSDNVYYDLKSKASHKILVLNTENDILKTNNNTRIIIGITTKQQLLYLINKEQNFDIFHIECNINQPIEKELLPKTLRSLTLGEKYDQKLEPLPKLLKFLTFLGTYNQIIEPDVLPENLKSLIFKQEYTKEFKKSAFANLKTLEKIEINSYNIKIKPNILPLTVNNLILFQEYNFKFDNGVLPSNLISLSFNSFNHSFENKLPNTLKILNLGNKYDIKFDVDLTSIINNKMDEVGKYVINNANILPSSLEVLTFGMNYNKKFEPYVLPQTLKTLSFGRKYDQVFDYGVLPSNLQNLILSENYNQDFVGILPQNLKKLIFKTVFNKKLDNILPPNLEILVLSSKYDQLIQKNTLPRNLIYLDLGSNYQYPLYKGMFPNSLTNLVLQNNYNSILNNDTNIGDILPPYLKYLQFGDIYDQVLNENSFSDSLFNSLESLIFGSNYNQNISNNVLKKFINLKYLSFGKYFNQNIDKNPNGFNNFNLLSNLKKLVVRNKTMFNTLSKDPNIKNILVFDQSFPKKLY